MSNPRAVSEQNIKRIKEDILALEIELEHAEKVLELALLRVERLRSALEEKRASIAPIRLVTFDILSLVFEWCSIADWTSPLRIGGVSRHWRSIVLNTPRAWRLIDMEETDGYISDIYFNRSKHCGLHFVANRFMDKKVADKIECLTMTSDPGDEDIPLSPQLDRFCFSDPENGFLNQHILSTSHFPLLRHLHMESLSAYNSDYPDLPPLETLVISALGSGGWYNIIQACKSSLLSLKIYECHYILLIDAHIELVNLLYLEIINRVHVPDRVELNLTTPILKTYIEGNSISKYSQIRCHIPKSITHMRLEYPQPATGLAQLQVLQMHMEFTQILKFLDEIKVNNYTYSSLKTLEFGCHEGPDYSRETMDAVLDTRDWSDFTQLTHRPKLVDDVWSVRLPGECVHLCGNNVPCAEWKGLGFDL